MKHKTYYLNQMVYNDSDHYYEPETTYKATEREYSRNDFRIGPPLDLLYIYVQPHEFKSLPRLYKAYLLSGIRYNKPWYDSEGYYHAKEFKILGKVDYKQLYEENPDNTSLFILTLTYNKEFRNYYLQLAKNHPEEIYKLDNLTKELLVRLNYKEFNDCLLNDPDINSSLAIAIMAVHFDDKQYLDILIDYDNIDIKRTLAGLDNKEYIDKLIATGDDSICECIALKILGDTYKLTQDERIKYLDLLVKNYNNNIQTYVVESAIKYNLSQYIEFYLEHETYPNIYYRTIETNNLDYIKRLTNSPIETVAKVAQDKLDELTSK